MCGNREHVHPEDGGCWFCHTDNGEMDFSTEFDAYFHMSCLMDEIEEAAYGDINPEVALIAEEFGVDVE